MAFTTELQPAYKQRRASIAQSFPAAHAFLGALEDLSGEGAGFHMGTTENVHLYKGDRFLAYVRMELATPSTPRLTLRARPNIAIKEGTRDDSRALFSKLTKLVMEHRGFADAWAEKGGNDEERVFRRDTPAAFFDALLALLRLI